LFCFVLFFVEYISRAHQQEKKLTRFFVGPTTFAHQHDKHKNSKKSDERLKRSKQARKRARAAHKTWSAPGIGWDLLAGQNQRELDESFGWEKVSLLDVAVHYSQWDH
jgi:hypothetical protein